jgi:uncharacterized membrane protein
MKNKKEVVLKSLTLTFLGQPHLYISIIMNYRYILLLLYLFFLSSLTAQTIVNEKLLPNDGAANGKRNKNNCK